jgi:mannose-1-phosphate guanylyltransferase / mannose-6-phosphate isomerase
MAITETPAIYPVILSGGAGTRLWPLSRALYPKQFQRLIHHNTLLQATALRVSDSDFSAPVVVCNEDHRFIVAEQFQAIDQTPGDIILEPVSRNTAPAITIAALWVREHNPDGLVLVMPSDHIIGDTEQFRDQIKALSKDARDGHIVTFGRPATFADPELGYIKSNGDLSSDNALAAAVQSFIEKPDSDMAERLINDGYSWNSGISLFKPQVFLSAMGDFAPATLSLCEEAWANSTRDLDFVRLAEAPYEKIAPSSVDKTVMEQAQTTVLSPLATTWQDVRTWSAVWQCSDKDADGNFVVGDAMTIDTRNCIVHSENHLTAVIGINDLSIVVSDDAVLVSGMGESGQVEEIVSRLAETGSTKHLHHPTIYRPWGSFRSILQAPGFQVKELAVKPGAQLSLQKHAHRAEHWIVVEGRAAIRRGDDDMLLNENESTYIPIGAVHRLANPGQIPLRVIEVQSGSYLGEDDIVRLDDSYGRH